MRISTRGRYALEAVLYLVVSGSRDYVSIKEIGENTDISENYLEQLFIPLKRANLIAGSRGAQGGYVLTKPAEEISVGYVLRAVEGQLNPVKCTVGSKVCSRYGECVTRYVWESMADVIDDVVSNISMADLADHYQNMTSIQDYCI